MATRHRSGSGQPTPVLDPYVCEHLLRPAFWLLGAALIVHSIATLTHTAPRDESPAEIPSQKTTSNSTIAGQSTQGDLQDTKTKHTALASPPTHPAQNPANRSPRHYTHRIAPYLTTRWRTAAAITAYLAIIAAQLLEGYWVASTYGRIMTELFRTFLWLARSGRWAAAAVYTLSMAFMALLGALGAYLGGLMVVVQVASVVEVSLGDG